MNREECWKIFLDKYTEFAKKEFQDCEAVQMPYEEIARKGVDASFGIPCYQNDDGSLCKPEPFFPIDGMTQMKLEIRASRRHGCWPIPERAMKRITGYMTALRAKRILIEGVRPGQQPA